MANQSLRDTLPDGEVAVEALPDGRYRASAWCPCRCGKVRWRTYYSDSETVARKYVELLVMTMGCRVCEADGMRRAQVCPEGGCIRREYAHTGRCEPLPPLTPEMLARLFPEEASRG